MIKHQDNLKRMHKETERQGLEKVSIDRNEKIGDGIETEREQTARKREECNPEAKEGGGRTGTQPNFRNDWK